MKEQVKLNNLTENKKTALNFIASAITFAINFVLSFLLTPYIVEHCGDAYGFVGLANNFISYANILVAAINSMAARFVTISIKKNDIDKAGRYFKTIFISDLIITAILALPSIFLILFMENIFNMDSAYAMDVKLLWLFLFSGFFMSLICSVFSIVYFATNRLYMSQRKQLGTNVIRAAIIILMFIFFDVKVAFLGLGTMIGQIYGVTFNMIHTKKMLPEISLSKSKFDKALLKEVLSSGVWNSFASLSNILLSSLDLLIVNLCVLNGDKAMTTVAVAKTLASLIYSFFGTISSIFAPTFTDAFALNDNEKLKREINKSIRILRFFAGIPIVFVLLYSKEFFTLYVPSQNATLLNRLAIIGSINFIFLAPFSAMDNIFIVFNKVKVFSISVFITAVISLATLFTCLSFTPENYKIYLVCGISLICIVIKGLTFTPIMVSKYTKQKWWAYYPQILAHLLGIVVLTAICYLIKLVFVVNSWVTLLLALAIITIIVLSINYFIVLRKEDRKFLLNLIKRKLKRR